MKTLGLFLGVVIGFFLVFVCGRAEQRCEEAPVIVRKIKGVIPHKN